MHRKDLTWIDLVRDLIPLGFGIWGMIVEITGTKTLQLMLLYWGMIGGPGIFNAITLLRSSDTLGPSSQSASQHSQDSSIL